MPGYGWNIANKLALNTNQSINQLKTIKIVNISMPQKLYWVKIFFWMFYYTPGNEVVGGYTGFTMSVRPSVDKSYVVR
jgi:hypothetical protein